MVALDEFQAERLRPFSTSFFAKQAAVIVAGIVKFAIVTSFEVAASISLVIQESTAATFAEQRN
jgi:hypothetical protein